MIKIIFDIVANAIDKVPYAKGEMIEYRKVMLYV